MKFVGIDVGGTNTDAVEIEDGKISYVKTPNETGSVVKSLKKIGRGADRIVVSSSLPLNVLHEGKGSATKIILIPGPGLDFSHLGSTVKGYVNHRGDIVEEIDLDELREELRDKKDNLAIIGKFSNRNPSLERKIYGEALNLYKDSEIALGENVQGLGFPRRVGTTILNAKIKRSVYSLTKEIRAVSSSFFYFKGDGGIIPDFVALENPMELVNSSPATAALGSYYLTGEDGLVVDIGGTTTDFVEIINGIPRVSDYITLFGHETLIRSAEAWAIPVGGDSFVRFSEDLRIGPERRENAVAFGGRYLTPTDALNCLGEEIGDYKKSIEAMKEVFNDYKSLSDEIIEVFVESICREASKVNPSKIICTGYLGRYLAPMIGRRLRCKYITPEHAEVANAVGAAVSRISLTLYMRIDTDRGKMVCNGKVEDIEERKFDPEEIISIAREKVRELAMEEGAAEEDVEDICLTYFDSYDIIRGGYRKGQISNCIVQISPGISSEVTR
jgi:N-methylhydantoinase A/oxoprolinase/acetone carboxylase beta subunit